MEVVGGSFFGQNQLEMKFITKVSLSKEAEEISEDLSFSDEISSSKLSMPRFRRSPVSLIAPFLTLTSPLAFSNGDIEPINDFRDSAAVWLTNTSFEDNANFKLERSNVKAYFHRQLEFKLIDDSNEIRGSIKESISRETAMLRIEGVELPNEQSIVYAEQLLVKIGSTTVQPKRIAPSIEGGMFLEFRNNEYVMFLEIFNDGDVNYLLKDVKSRRVIDCRIVENMSSIFDEIIRRFTV